jgi:hypothetical protein
MNPNETLWLCGQWRSGLSPTCVWDFQGIFDTEEQAVAACCNENCFVAPVELNAVLSEEPTPFPEAYYPSRGKP